MAFTTKTGVELHLKKVNLNAIQDMLMRGGGLAAMKNVANLPEDQQEPAIRYGNNLTNYVFGYGVQESPDAQALKELKELGIDTSLEKASRSAWLRYIVLSDKDESAELLKEILTFSAE